MQLSDVFHCRLFISSISDWRKTYLNISGFQWILMSYDYGLIQNEANVVKLYSYDHCLQPHKRICYENSTMTPIYIATTIEVIANMCSDHFCVVLLTASKHSKNVRLNNRSH